MEEKLKDKEKFSVRKLSLCKGIVLILSMKESIDQGKYLKKKHYQQKRLSKRMNSSGRELY